MSGPATPRGGRYAVPGLRLAYREWGPDDAPVLLLVHGRHDHARSWDWTARALADRWRVVAPDLRGHGDSDWSPDGAYAAPHIVADLAALVAHLGATRVAIAAHSMGAAVALRYAALFPERVSRLAAIEGIGLEAAAEPGDALVRMRRFVEGRLAAADVRPRRFASVDGARARMRAANPRLDEARLAHLTAHALAAEGDGYRWKHDPALRGHYPLDLSPDEQRALWRAIACPVWLVHGAESWAEHPDAHGRAAEFRDATVTSYAGAGHWVQHDRFDAFVADLAAWLAEGIPAMRNPSEGWDRS